MVQPREHIIFKTAFARVATALWSFAGLLVVLVLVMLHGLSPTQTTEAAQSVQASAHKGEKLADSSPMLRASGHVMADDKLD
jgi:hypothetical protein